MSILVWQPERSISRTATAGGIGAKMSPSAVLVVSGGNTRLVNLKNQDAVTKIIDMAPEVVDKVLGLFKKDKTEEEKNVDKAINDVAQSEESVTE